MMYCSWFLKVVLSTTPTPGYSSRCTTLRNSQQELGFALIFSKNVFFLSFHEIAECSPSPHVGKLFDILESEKIRNRHHIVFMNLFLTARTAPFLDCMSFFLPVHTLTWDFSSHLRFTGKNRVISVAAATATQIHLSVLRWCFFNLHGFRELSQCITFSSRSSDKDIRLC